MVSGFGKRYDKWSRRYRRESRKEKILEIKNLLLSYKLVTSKH